MKKTIALLLSALLLLTTLAGCGSKPAEENRPTTAESTPAPAEPVEDTESAPEPETPAEPEETAEPEEGTEPEDAPQEAAYSPEGSVLFEKDGLKVTSAGLDYDPTDWEPRPIIWVDVENAGEEDAYLSIANGSINGFMGNVLLIDFIMEDGEYVGADYDFQQTVPAGGSCRYALGYYSQDIPGTDPDTLAELEFCFALAEDEYSWPSYYSAPVRIATGETLEAVDIASLGSVVLDNDKIRIAIGEQDYSDWFGPLVSVYVENKTDHFLGLSADSAEGDGVYCDYIYYDSYLAPGKLAASNMSFDGELGELKGIENLTVNFSLWEADSRDELSYSDPTALGPIQLQYPPQVWGEYENGGLNLDIRPKYNELLTVETPENDPQGILFTVSETASLEAGGYEGAGWLFSIGRADEEKLHEVLCYDMSGVEVFARDEQGQYYLYYHPTDVRFERASAEEMEADFEQWSMLCAWADEARDSFTEKNDLDYASYGNSPVEMYLARAAWMDGANATLSTTEFGPVPIEGVDGAPYVEDLMQSYFWYTEEEAPDGEYVVLAFPDEDVRLDFFFAPGGYVRVATGDHEELYQAAWEDEERPCAEIMQEWYYAAAEQAGLMAS